MRNLKAPTFFVWLAFLLELSLLTFGRNMFGYHGSPVFLLLAGIAIGALPIFFNIKPVQQSLQPKSRNIWRWTSWLIFIFSLLICASELRDLIEIYPIDPTGSDVIPAIDEIYVKRTLQGEFVYQPFHDFGYPIFPNYLPLQWMPYVISGLLTFDHRWTAFGVLCIAILLMQIRLQCRVQNLIELLLKSLLPWIVLYLYLLFCKETFGYALESLIAGYYVIFGLSILSSSNWKRAGGILLTLMSRIIALLFIPLYVFIGLVAEGQKQVLKISLLVIAGVLIVYVIPFMAKDPAIFFKGFDMYSSAAPNEWYPRGPENRPPHLYRGTGMAFWFYTFVDGSIEEKISILRSVQISLTVGITVLLGFIYYIRKDKIEHRLFLLLAFKIYLAFFLGFIQVPYVYLFLTSIMFSTLVLSELSWRTEDSGS